MEEKSKVTVASNLEKIYDDIIPLGLLLQGETIDDFKCINPKHDTLSITNINPGKPKVVLRIQSSSCSSCVSEILGSIVNFGKTNSIRDIYIFTDFKTFREFLVFTKEYPLELNFFNIIQGFEICEIDSWNTPYFFLLDGLNVRKVFLPMAGKSELTHSFLEIASIINE